MFDNWSQVMLPGAVICGVAAAAVVVPPAPGNAPGVPGKPPPPVHCWTLGTAEGGVNQPVSEAVVAAWLYSWACCASVNCNSDFCWASCLSVTPEVAAANCCSPARSPL